MTQPGWPSRLTGVIAAEIRRLRTQRGMSAQQLSDRCAQLGLEISRPTLADLENGRRTALSVAELIVLARALDVSPTLLLAPVGRQETIEILPGRRIAPWDVARWLAGEVDLRDAPDGALRVVLSDDDNDPLYLFRAHGWAVARWRGSTKTLMETASGELVPVDDAWLEEQRRGVIEDLRRLRSRMRKLDLLLPPVPPELADVDQLSEDSAHT